MIILGLNAWHGDAAACLLRDGAIVAAAEEERFRRVKHWAGLPSEAARWCLAEAGARLEDVAVIAINQDARANFWRKAAYALARRPHPRLLLERVRNLSRRAGVAPQLEAALGGEFRGRVEAVEHHLAHLASAYAVSPFEEAVALSVDGFGDFASAGWGAGRGGAVRLEGRVLFPHSLGIFYQAMTQYLGFPHYGDEYKVMGLAPYGEPAFMGEMRRLVNLLPDGAFELDLAYYRHATEPVAMQWEGGAPEFGPLYSAPLAELLGPPRDPAAELTQRHRDLARSAQAMYEEAFFHLLAALHRRYGLQALCLAGGCALNSVANGKVFARSAFRRLYVQAAAGDAGGALGAALVAWQRSGAAARPRMEHAYWGPAYGEEEIGRLLDERRAQIQSAGCRIERLPEEHGLIERVARAISEGAVTGWFQGRMEWGPRALGNRSILCDPRRADMKELLNAKIKRRESFRPFAPSVLREAVPDWFEEDDDVPFMMQVHPIRPEKRPLVPAVTHVDGSGRLQTVTREGNALYYRLIEAFAARTGVPMLLNTSFNENEPVVCRPEEALDCFLRTRMDLLALGRWVVSR